MAPTLHLLDKKVRALLLDSNRICHVPGIAWRRALVLHDERALNALSSPCGGDGGDGGGPPKALVIIDNTLVVHDLAALFEDLPAQKRDSEYLGNTRPAVWTDAATKASVLRHQADVLVAAAATGDVALLQALLNDTDEPDFEGIHVDLAKMVEVARVNDHDKIVKRLVFCAQTGLSRLLGPLEIAQEGFAKGEADALAKLNGKPQRQSVAGSRTLDDEPATVTTTMPPSPSYACVGMAVLTNTSLLPQIGVYLEDPLTFVDRFEQRVPGRKDHIGHVYPISLRVGVLPRLAIIRGDLDALKQIYYVAYCKRSSAAPRPWLKFQLTMHLAACEGRLEILQWLHSRSHKYPQEICCRPDTMAMAVRCGWADVVEWLHLNRPESAQSMSEFAINDAAKWGHVDVLRVCHKYQLSTLTEETIACAARAGHVQVVQFLLSLDHGSLTPRAAMDAAVEHGQVDVVTYLYESCGQQIRANSLVLALKSTDNVSDAMVQLLWCMFDRTTTGAASEVAAQAFESVCANRSKRVVTTLLPFVECDKTAIERGLLAAVPGDRIGTVRLLLLAYTLDSPTLYVMLQRALEIQSGAMVTLLVKTGRLSPEHLAEAFRAAVKTSKPQMVALLIDLHVDEHCGNALALVVQAQMQDALEAMHPRRTRNAAIEALKCVPTSQMATLLLMKENKFYTEQILLDNAPAFLLRKCVRYFLYRSRQPRLDTAASFEAVLEEDTEYLTLSEVEHIWTGTSQDLKSHFVARHQDLLGANFITLCLEAKQYELITSLYHALKSPRLFRYALSVACQRGRADDIEMLMKLGGIVTDKYDVTDALDTDNVSVIRALLSYPSEHNDGVFLRVLREKLAVGDAETDHRVDNGSARPKHTRVIHQPQWAMSLLQVLVQSRPDQHATLLGIAAESGSLTAVQFILGPRSGVNVAAIPKLPPMVAAARRSHMDVIQLLYANKSGDEVVDVRQLRDQFNCISDAAAVQSLLTLLEQWDPQVRQVLVQEREAASALFGLPSSSSSPPRSVKSKSTQTAKTRRCPR